MDEKMSFSTIYRKSSDLNLHSTSKQMIDYCKNNSQCRCCLIFEDFPDCQFINQGCQCCDVCQKSCICEQCGAILLDQYFFCL